MYFDLSLPILLFSLFNLLFCIFYLFPSLLSHFLLFFFPYFVSPLACFMILFSLTLSYHFSIPTHLTHSPSSYRPYALSFNFSSWQLFMSKILLMFGVFFVGFVCFVFLTMHFKELYQCGHQVLPIYKLANRSKKRLGLHKAAGIQ